MLLQLSLWSAIVGLYLAIGGTLGALIRKVAARGNPGWDRFMGTAYTGLLFAAASAFVLAIEGWAEWVRISLVGAGVAVAWVAAARPAWLPERVWRPAFGHGCLAAVMALAALWGINQAMAGSPTAPLTIAITALAAGAVSSGTALRLPGLPQTTHRAS